MSYSRSEYSQSLETINEDLDGVAQNMERLSVEEKTDKKRLKEVNGKSLTTTSSSSKSKSCPVLVKSLKNASSSIKSSKESVDNAHSHHLVKDGDEEADGAPN